MSQTVRRTRGGLGGLRGESMTIEVRRPSATDRVARRHSANVNARGYNANTHTHARIVCNVQRASSDNCMCVRAGVRACVRACAGKWQYLPRAHDEGTRPPPTGRESLIVLTCSCVCVCV